MVSGFNVPPCLPSAQDGGGLHRDFGKNVRSVCIDESPMPSISSFHTQVPAMTLKELPKMKVSQDANQKGVGASQKAARALKVLSKEIDQFFSDFSDCIDSCPRKIIRNLAQKVEDAKGRHEGQSQAWKSMLDVAGKLLPIQGEQSTVFEAVGLVSKKFNTHDILGEYTKKNIRAGALSPKHKRAAAQVCRRRIKRLDHKAKREGGLMPGCSELEQYARDQYNLGCMYATGVGVGGINPFKAMVCFEEAKRTHSQAARDILDKISTRADELRGSGICYDVTLP